MEERIDLIVPEKQRAGGVSLAIATSFVVHGLLIYWVVISYKPIAAPANTPIPRYVQLLKQDPREFVEAPGPAVATAPLNAPYSDANRKASTPKPTGDTPTKRPGDDGGRFTPPVPRGSLDGNNRPINNAPETNRQENAAEQTSSEQRAEDANGRELVYRPNVQQAQASAGVDWRSAIKEVGKVASLGTGQQGFDLGQQSIGGDKGFAENGPLSFETQWYDWGPYAQSMVSRIRVNWYTIMPDLIRTGMQGVVTIRFTIQRDGRITNLEIVKSSGVPPYDNAAKRAIENSSPLNALPKDFPNATERVTCMFYYNMQVPD